MANAPLPSIPLGNLAGLPSPSVGDQGAGPGFLGNLLQAAPAYLQGMQQAQQAKEVKMKLQAEKQALAIQTQTQAMEKFKNLAPYSVMNPTDSKLKDTLLQAAQAAGIPPTALINPDGSYNVSFLKQYDQMRPFWENVLENASKYSPEVVRQAVKALGGGG
ncbi:MAG: hypothetical protein ACREQ5_25635, partial [Candidatus Dormibacteria bacterium]